MPKAVSEGSTWDEYVQRHLDVLGWTPRVLATHAEVDQSAVGRWINEGKLPTIDAIRRVCKALHRDIREGLVAADYFTGSELGLDHPVPVPPDPALLDDEELLFEVERRMRARRVLRGKVEEKAGNSAEGKKVAQAAVEASDTAESSVDKADTPSTLIPNFSSPQRRPARQ